VRGAVGGREEGGGGDHTEAGWSKAIRDLVFCVCVCVAFFFLFLSAAPRKGTRRGDVVEKEEGGRRAADGKGGGRGRGECVYT